MPRHSRCLSTPMFAWVVASWWLGGLRGGGDALALSPARPRVSAMATTMSTSSISSTNKPKSALVFGWFQATDRQLSTVKAKYQKAGFDEVTVVPTSIADLSRPYGWFRTYAYRHARAAESHLNRPYDVVHCLSGGFLNYYLLRAAGVDLRAAKTLVMDSTPILPTPLAFTRFARAYAAAAGKDFLRHVPLAVHHALSWVVWCVETTACWVDHLLGRLVTSLWPWRRRRSSQTGTATPAPAETPGRWLRRFSPGVYARDFEPLVNATLDRVYGDSPTDLLFVYNPDDPFIAEAEVRRCMDHARGLGHAVREHRVPLEHVATVIRKPNVLFSLL